MSGQRLGLEARTASQAPLAVTVRHHRPPPGAGLGVLLGEGLGRFWFLDTGKSCVRIRDSATWRLSFYFSFPPTLKQTQRRDTQTHRHADTQTHRHRHTHTHTQTQTHRHIQTHRDTTTQGHRERERERVREDTERPEIQGDRVTQRDRKRERERERDRDRDTDIFGMCAYTGHSI